MNRPPRVVMVSAGFHPYVGGAEKQALELSVALRARGLDVRVATRRLPGLPVFEEVRGVPVDRLWCAGSGGLNSATFLVSLFVHLVARARTYDAIHVHLAGSPALAAAAAGRLLGKRVVVKLGGGRGIGELAASSRSTFGRLKLSALRRLAPAFIAVARDLAEEAGQYLGDVSVTVLPNGVDLEAYRPLSSSERAEQRRRLGWPDGVGFLYTGRLSAEKRLPAFVSAWAACAKAGAVPTFAAFVGDGPQEQAIRAAARAAGVEDRVYLHASRDDIAQVYGAADVFVLPSISEGLSNALLEAMACGLPILASRVGGTPEAVTDGKTGLLFAVDDAEELKAEIRMLLEQPGLAARLGAAAREAAAERFSLARLARSYEELYYNPLVQGSAP